MKKQKWYLKQIMGILAIGLLLGITHPTMAMELETKPYNEKYIEWVNLPEEERQGTIAPAMYVKNIENEATTFSMRNNVRLLGTNRQYSLLDTISLKLKNQMQTGQCWAFSTTTQLESYMAKINKKTVEYSPRHIEYSTAKTFLDGINPDGFNREVNSGGNFLFSYAYMARGQGPILEKDMPFVNTSEKIRLSEIQNKTTQAKLEEFKVFPSIYKEKINGKVIYTNGQTGSDKIVYTNTQITDFRNSIKEHIMTYGGVAALTYTGGKEYFSNKDIYVSSEAYCCDNPNAKADHQVTIIGWDDDYAITNFNEDHRPTTPGAWLVQNSYGTQIKDTAGNIHPVFDKGLLYISYEDCLIETLMGGIISVDEVDYDHIYQYDPLGTCGTIGNSTAKEIYMANVFKKESGTAYLNEVSFYTVSGEKYEIYVNAVDGSMSGENFKKVKTVGKTNSDYITVKLDYPIKLTGSQFVVGIKYISDTAGVYVPIEARRTSVVTFATATSNIGESFASEDGKTWSDCKNLNIAGIQNINACIKAFTTKTTTVPEVITLKSNAYTIAQTGKVIKKVSPDTNVTNFKRNLITDGTIKLYNGQGVELSSTQIIGTGMTLKVTETSDVYKIVVTGDVNGDGKITATDLLKVKKDIVGIEKLKSEYSTAGDVNESGGLTSTDMLKIKQVICKMTKF